MIVNYLDKDDLRRDMKDIIISVEMPLLICYDAALLAENMLPKRDGTPCSKIRVSL